MSDLHERHFDASPVQGSAELLLALRWCNEPADPAVRGRRLTAFMVELAGPVSVDGMSTVKQVAQAKRIAEATLHEHRGILRRRYGMGAKRTFVGRSGKQQPESVLPMKTAIPPESRQHKCTGSTINPRTYDNDTETDF